MQRTLRFDGILPTKLQGEMTPADLQEMNTWLAQHRDSPTPFDIVMEGETPGDDPVAATAILRPLATAGVTWWLESVWATPEITGRVEGMKKRIQQGPSRLPPLDLPA